MGSKPFLLNFHPEVILEFRQNSREISSVIKRRNSSGKNNDVEYVNFPLIPASEPVNVIYPYTSKRKVAFYGESIKSEHKNKITGDLTHLYARVDSLCSSSLSNANEFKRVSKDILSRSKFG